MENNENKKSSKVGKIIFSVLIIAIIFVIGLGVGAVVLGYSEDGKKTDSADKQPSGGASVEISDSKTYNEKGDGDTLTGVEIAAKVKPSVVGVLTYSRGTLYGEGSAVVMGEDKTGTYTYFITCAHIISTKGIDTEIVLEDETTYDAEIVGYDVRTDVGVLRVKATGFTAAEFGDSSVLQVGEPIYAIGNPGGTAFYGSFTGGYISAIDRPTSATESAYSMECIQHDAAINPGNSGGALVNSYGQVIGINSSKIADEEYEGMGFAVPISVAKEIVDDIIESGYVTDRAKLGISYISASQYQTYNMIVKMNKLPSGSIIIAEIEENSAFAGTDVATGDMIIAANGKDLDDADVLLSLIEDAGVGDELKLTIARVNDDYTVEKFDVTVKLVEDKGTSASTEEATTEGFTNPFER